MEKTTQRFLESRELCFVTVVIIALLNSIVLPSRFKALACQIRRGHFSVSPIQLLSVTVTIRGKQSCFVNNLGGFDVLLKQCCSLSGRSKSCLTIGVGDCSLVSVLMLSGPSGLWKVVMESLEYQQSRIQGHLMLVFTLFRSCGSFFHDCDGGEEHIPSLLWLLGECHTKCVYHTWVCLRPYLWLLRRV